MDKLTSDDTIKQVKDVVCGMSIDPSTAQFKSEYEGKTYYFCSQGCKNQFDESPKQYSS